MDDVVELELSQMVNVTNTMYIRRAVAQRIVDENLEGPPVELVRFHVVVHCTRGSGQHMVDFVDHDLTPGTALWIRPGQVQRWSNVHDDFDAEVAVFQSPSVPSLPLFNDLLGATAVTHLGDDAERLSKQIAWMAEDLEANQDEATSAAVVAVILRLLARNIRRPAEEQSSPGRKLANDFVSSVDTHIDQRSVAWHSRQIGASSRSVARATVSTLGQSPKEVLDARVILEAQRQLAWSDADIGTIARVLRFSEASNFTKFFRRLTGASPSDFRAAVAELESEPQLRV